MTNPRRRGRWIVAALVVGASAIAVTACATALSAPKTIVVSKKQTVSRWQSQVVGSMTVPSVGPSGAPRDVERPVRREDIVREYWVKDTLGHWYRIGKRDWDTAVVGQSLTIHPAPLPEREPGPSATWPCIGPDGRWRC